LFAKRAARRIGIWVLVLLLVATTAIAFSIWRSAQAFRREQALKEERERLRDRQNALKEKETELNQQAADIYKQKATLYDAQSIVADSLASVQSNPERSMLLALQAIQMEFAAGGKASQPAEDALRIAVESTRTDQVLIAPKGAVRVVAFGGDGRLLASVEGISTISLWNSFSGRQLAALKAGHSAVLAIAFSPDASELAIGSDDGTIRLLDTATLGDRASPMKTADGVRTLAFRPDGLQLASGGPNGRVVVWDVSASSAERSLPGQHGPINSIAFSPSGQRLLIGGDEGAMLWDLSPGGSLTPIPYGDRKKVFSVAFSSDDRLLAIGGDNKVAQTFDAWQLNRPTSEITSTAPISHVCFCKGRLWASSLDGSVRAPGTILVGNGGPVHAMDCAPDGERIASAGDSNHIRIWDPNRGAEYLRFKAHPSQLDALHVSRNGARIVTVGADQMRVWDANTGRLFFQVSAGVPADVTFTRDGKRIAVAYEDHVELRGSLDGTPKGRFSYSPSSIIPTFSLNGERLVVGDGVWDVDSGRRLLPFSGGRGVAAFSTDGSVLANIENGLLRVWNIFAKAAPTEIKIPDDVSHLAISPDRERIVITADKVARIWDLRTKRPVVELVGHSERINNLVWSRKLIATSSDDGSVRIWDSESGRQVGIIPNHSGAVRNVLFKPDGSGIITSDESGEVRVSPVDFRGLVALALGMLTRTWTDNECDGMEGKQACLQFAEVFRPVVEGNRLARLGDISAAAAAYARAGPHLASCARSAP